MAIKVANSVIPSKIDTPLDARTRVNYVSDIANIESPATGQLVYCTDTGKFYVVKTLKAKKKLLKILKIRRLKLQKLKKRLKNKDNYGKNNSVF